MKKADFKTSQTISRKLLKTIERMKTKKTTNTFIPRGVKHFHFSMEAFNIKKIGEMSNDEKGECLEYFDECIAKVVRMKYEFSDHIN